MANGDPFVAENVAEGEGEGGEQRGERRGLLQEEKTVKTVKTVKARLQGGVAFSIKGVV